MFTKEAEFEYTPPPSDQDVTKMVWDCQRKRTKQTKCLISSSLALLFYGFTLAIISGVIMWAIVAMGFSDNEALYVATAFLALEFILFFTVKFSPALVVAALAFGPVFRILAQAEHTKPSKSPKDIRRQIIKSARVLHAVAS